MSLPADFSGDGAFVVLSTGGDGDSRRQGWAIRGLCIGTRDKKERVDFARGVALESCFFLHFLHEHNCAFFKYHLRVPIKNNNTKHVIILTGAACKSYRCEWGWATTL